jgi:hypothetical protein
MHQKSLSIGILFKSLHSLRLLNTIHGFSSGPTEKYRTMPWNRLWPLHSNVLPLHLSLHYTTLHAMKRGRAVSFTANRPIYWSQGAGFNSRTSQHMRQPVMDIIVLPCLDFFRGFFLFMYKSLHRNNNCNSCVLTVININIFIIHNGMDRLNFNL